MNAPATLGTPYQNCVHDQDQQLAAKVSKWTMQAAARRLLPEWRVAFCHRRIKDKVMGVRAVVGNGDGGPRRAWYRGLHLCGSVWHCPVCAAKISERRRAELQEGIDAQVAKGGSVILLTLTFPHALTDSLRVSIQRFTDATRRLKSGRRWKDIKARYGICGGIRALEVTHGDNGWHPHTHEIVFVERPLLPEQLVELKNDVYALWCAATQQAGLPRPSAEHGVDVLGAIDVAEYVGKWGFASELVKAHIKEGKRRGRTPWKLLRDYVFGDAQAGALFAEFARCFKGRNQLFWSRGLRDQLKLQGELFTDEELAALEPDGDKIEHRIDSDDWHIVVRFGQREAVLDCALEGEGRLREFLAELRARARREFGSDGAGGRRSFVAHLLNAR